MIAIEIVHYGTKERERDMMMNNCFPRQLKLSDPSDLFLFIIFIYSLAHMSHAQFKTQLFFCYFCFLNVISTFQALKKVFNACL